MADLMDDDVSLRKVARRLKAFAWLPRTIRYRSVNQQLGRPFVAESRTDSRRQGVVSRRFSPEDAAP